jgi:type VI secretion system protein ImpG
MKDELLRYYEQELGFFRQMAGEFADKYPKIAGRLQLEPDKCEDPHVERLIEAFALISGRIQKKIHDEFPEITEALLGLLYPHYLRAIPSMSVVQFQIDSEQAKLSEGYLVERDSALYAKPSKGTPCQFRTCYPTTLWPLEVVSAAVLPGSALASASSTPGDAVGAIRIELRCQKGIRLSELGVERLRFFIDAQNQVANTLLELLFSKVMRVAVRDLSKGNRSREVLLSETCLSQVGFEKDESVLPYPDRSFRGYRLLQEYFCFPEKFFFFDLLGLEQAAKAGFGERFEVLFYLQDFERKDRLQQLEQSVASETFKLGCAPIVNLFHRCAEPVRLTHTRTEYLVVPDLHARSSTEVYSVDRVASIPPYGKEGHEYEPIYSFRHAYQNETNKHFWYSTRRPSTLENVTGSEVYLSLVDLGFDPSLPPVDALMVHVTCTNRDLPARLPFTFEFGELQVESNGLLRARCLRKPTETFQPPIKRGLQWRLISHLALNYLSIVEGREALQEILKLYDFSESPFIQQQIAGITRVSSASLTARVTSEAGVVFCLGMNVNIEFDESLYVGSGVYLFASVLERFLGLYCALNSFSQLTVTSKQRKRILKQWLPRSGEQILL